MFIAFCFAEAGSRGATFWLSGLTCGMWHVACGMYPDSDWRSRFNGSLTICHSLVPIPISLRLLLVRLRWLAILPIRRLHPIIRIHLRHALGYFAPPQNPLSGCLTRLKWVRAKLFEEPGPLVVVSAADVSMPAVFPGSWSEAAKSGAHRDHGLTQTALLRSSCSYAQRYTVRQIYWAGIK